MACSFIIKLSGPIPGKMLIVLSSFRTATEVLSRLAMVGSVTKVIIPILTICSLSERIYVENVRRS